MARTPPQPDRDRFEGTDLEAFDTLVARYGGVDNVMPYWGALLNSPPFAAALGRLGTLVRTAGDREGTYSHADRELVDQVLAPHLGTNVVMRGHIPDALSTGVRIEAIEALLAGRDEDLDDDERLLATYIRQVVDGTVTDDTWAAVEARLGTRGLVEYTIFIVLLQLIMRLHQAFGLPDPPTEELVEMVREFREGTREVPDYRARIR